MLLSVTPEILLPPVWPLPLSLATTRGISVDFFSSPYLDVSVREVPYVKLCIHLTIRNAWVSPFGNPRIEAYLQLPEAYRSLSRPSSAPDAKAFTLCSSSLELSYFTWFSFFFELLEFHKTNNLIRLLILFCEKVLSFCSLNCFPPFGEIVIYP